MRDQQNATTLSQPHCIVMEDDMDWNLTPHRSKLIGALLVGVGAIVLLTQFFGGTAHYLWPFFIIVPGLVLVAVAMSAGDTVTRLAIPGTTIAGIGLILFFQNLFNYYQSWAYVWALIPAFVAFGMHLSTEPNPDGEAASPSHLMTWSLTVFVVLAAVFELFIFDGGVFAARIVLPLGLILIGAAFLFGWIGPIQGHDKEPADQK